MKTLTIIGAGKVGKTLGHLLVRTGDVSIQGVLNYSLESSEQAVQFIGQGKAYRKFSDLEESDFIMVTVPDGEIETVCEQLVEAGKVKQESVLFHCSGALSSEILLSATREGAFVASVHPVKSFADPKQAVGTFSGTWCGLEGDSVAEENLKSLFCKTGANFFELNTRYKTHYHAASVIICNYLVTLFDISLKTYEKAGIPRDTALKIVGPLVRGTLDNLLKFDTIDSLTGPISRGDHDVVSRQLDALSSWDPEIGSIYRHLGKLTLDIAKDQGAGTMESFEKLGVILQEENP